MVAPSEADPASDQSIDRVSLRADGDGGGAEPASGAYEGASVHVLSPAGCSSSRLKFTGLTQNLGQL
jgi:hypothetical protein